MQYCDMTDKSEDETQVKIRQRIKKALGVTGWSPSRLAKEAGLAASTLSRFLYQPVKYTISLKTMAKVDTAVKKYLDSLPFGSEVMEKQLRYFKTAPDSLTVGSPDIINIYVHGIVQAGHWAPANEEPFEDWKQISLPRPDTHEGHFGLKVKGPSMNKVYPEGTILVCVPIHLFNHDLTQGEHVIVQRFDGDYVEATVKELQYDDNGQIWLWPRSDHPEYQTPIKLPKNSDKHEDHEHNSGEQIHVTAVVVADYRVRTRPRNKK